MVTCCSAAPLSVSRFLSLRRGNVFVLVTRKINRSDKTTLFQLFRGKIRYLRAPMKWKKICLWQKICLHLEPAAVLFDTRHSDGCQTLGKHVLRGDGRGLASSCSYRSLLALLLLPCFSVITADKGKAASRICHRVTLTCVGSGERTRERGWRGGGGKDDV